MRISFSLTLFRNVSSDRANNKGERRYPCRVPFDMVNGAENTPFALTQACGLEYKWEIH